MILSPKVPLTHSPPSLSSLFKHIFAHKKRFFFSIRLDYPRGEQRNSNQPLLPVNTFMLSDEKREELITEDLLIPRDDLQLVAEIGEGNFGVVFKGLLKISAEEASVEVAVKTLKPPRRKFNCKRRQF